MILFPFIDLVPPDQRGIEIMFTALPFLDFLWALIG
jgi:hypothetical protein